MAQPIANLGRTSPPSHLGLAGRRLWSSITRDYAIDNDALLAHLEIACGALDRLAQCRDVIAKEGLVIETKDGEKVSHPLLKIESAARSAFGAAMRALRLRPSVSDRSYS
jgi:P27 family predicted phage terminase small subunit